MRQRIIANRSVLVVLVAATAVTAVGGMSFSGFLVDPDPAKLGALSSGGETWPYAGLEGLLLAQAGPADPVSDAAAPMKRLGASSRAGVQSTGESPRLIGVVSRMTHQTTAGPADFDIPLSLTDPASRLMKCAAHTSLWR